MKQRTIRALVFEDEEIMRSLLAAFLEERGYEVVSFSSPTLCPINMETDCRCGPRHRCADILITDLRMPGVTGLEYIEKQRNKGCKCPYCAIVSGDVTPEDLKTARSLNCRVFEKPFDPDELHAWLDEVEQEMDLDIALRDWFRPD